MSFDDSTISRISSGGGTCAINSITERHNGPRGKTIDGVDPSILPESQHLVHVLSCFQSNDKPIYF
jgi:hypothetical protein